MIEIGVVVIVSTLIMFVCVILIAIQNFPDEWETRLADIMLEPPDIVMTVVWTCGHLIWCQLLFRTPVMFLFEIMIESIIYLVVFSLGIHVMRHITSYYDESIDDAVENEKK